VFFSPKLLPSNWEGSEGAEKEETEEKRKVVLNYKGKKEEKRKRKIKRREKNKEGGEKSIPAFPKKDQA